MRQRDKSSLNLLEQEALAMALKAFSAQIPSASTPDLVLKLAMESSSGTIAWALVDSEQWTDVVRDGDEIRLGCSGAGSEVAGRRDPGPLVTFRASDTQTGRILKMFLPETYEVSCGERPVGMCHVTFIKRPHGRVSLLLS
jgi:hypothetical protein